ncbi:cellulase family glycosylhydrolase [Bdellovibrio reynosensis]|uniref:Cellulase family glycosylhydrolase n=1 Tax=Bdellovibrio reynosensis TaxID=2835041 RepID=A0ABY4C571_9BACT|nr:cellulase family glycosylhydrolase [Bdellovibrio reynosensis]UOF00110.1 cellulase family glycosylhydrolase [Bdellovibrio reynosensis]
MSKWSKKYFTALMLFGFLSPALVNAGVTSVSGTTNYGQVTIGQSKTTTFTIKNIGSQNVRLDSHWFSGSTEFSKVGGTCGFNTTSGWTLKRGKSCTVLIKYAPQVAGAVSGKFTFGYYLGSGWTWEENSISYTGTGANPVVVNPTPTPTPTPTPVPATGWLNVVGNKIVNANGQTVILKGVNIADPEHLNLKTWERPGVSARSVANLATDTYKAKVIRLPILPGDPAYPNEGFFSATNGWDKYFNNHIAPLVTELTNKGIYVIIDLHYVSNYDTLYSKVEAFWKYMAPKFANNPYVIYEMFNEPIYPDNWSTWRTTIAQPIANLIRSYAPNNLLLVGGPYWSSHIAGAATDPVLGKNIVYVAHVYANQTISMWDSRYGAVADKYPLFITEWGFESGGTEGGDITYGQNFETWMRNRGLSWTVWSFDILWGPRMFNSDWTLKPGPGGMGVFVRDLLAQ